MKENYMHFGFIQWNTVNHDAVADHVGQDISSDATAQEQEGSSDRQEEYASQHGWSTELFRPRLRYFDDRE
jgi:hypothetical protein